MPNKDIDRREEILNHEYRMWIGRRDVGGIYPRSFPEAYKDSVINAMDENGKAMCFDLLEYMAKRNIECRLNKYGEHVFWDGDAGLTKEQLFENFL